VSGYLILSLHSRVDFDATLIGFVYVV